MNDNTGSLISDVKFLKNEFTKIKKQLNVLSSKSRIFVTKLVKVIEKEAITNLLNKINSKQRLSSKDFNAIAEKVKLVATSSENKPLLDNFLKEVSTKISNVKFQRMIQIFKKYITVKKARAYLDKVSSMLSKSNSDNNINNKRILQESLFQLDLKSKTLLFIFVIVIIFMAITVFFKGFFIIREAMKTDSKELGPGMRLLKSQLKMFFGTFKYLFSFGLAGNNSENTNSGEDGNNNNISQKKNIFLSVVKHIILYIVKFPFLVLSIPIQIFFLFIIYQIIYVWRMFVIKSMILSTILILGFLIFYFF